MGIENWLRGVEKGMRESIRILLGKALVGINKGSKTKWV